MSARPSSVLDTIAAAAMIAASAGVLWAIWSARQPPEVRPPHPVARRSFTTATLASDSMKLSGRDAVVGTSPKVVVVQFSDFECPYCARAAQTTISTLRREYIDTGKILFDFRHFPLTDHPLARQAAEASECARTSGSFWAMHDTLFEGRENLQPLGLTKAALKIGLIANAFENCLARGEMRSRVDDDIKLARRLQIGGTPTFMFGLLQPDATLRISKVLIGVLPDDALHATLAPLLKSASGDVSQSKE